MTAEGPHTNPGLLAGHATVAEAAALLPTEPLAVSPQASVAELVERLAERPSVHTIAVVDEAGRLIGIIPLSRLVDDLFLRVAPEVFLRHLLDAKAGPEDLQAHTARTAGELMEAPLSVRETSTVRDAFRIMREHHLEAIPVVDEEQRVVGELDLIELLLLWLRALQPHLP